MKTSAFYQTNIISQLNSDLKEREEVLSGGLIDHLDFLEPAEMGKLFRDIAIACLAVQSVGPILP